MTHPNDFVAMAQEILGETSPLVQVFILFDVQSRKQLPMFDSYLIQILRCERIGVAIIERDFHPFGC